jgi:hypothetical protein
MKRVSDYAGLSFKDILNLDIDEYKLLLRDAFIFNCQQSEEGQKYLNDCWVMQQTKPNREGLRKMQKGGKR